MAACAGDARRDALAHVRGAAAARALGARRHGRYATGKPFTPLVAADARRHAAIRRDARRAAARTTALDARVTRYLFGDGMALVYLEMLNLLDRRNVMSYTYSTGARRVPVNSVFAHRTFVLGVELQFN
jgi:hypothetical protein